MRQIVYFSTAAGQQDAFTLAAILAVSRDHNLRGKVSGLLVAGGHRYLQVIEGPKRVVKAMMERIRRDHRHVGVTVMVDRKLAERSFAGWSMAFFEEPQLGDFATLSEMITHARVHAIGHELRQQLDCFARSFVITGPVQMPSPWTLASSYEQKLALDRGHK